MADLYDLVVVGGGSAGLVGAMIAAGSGAQVALIERDRTGGDCLWTGCVPSKALIASAKVAHTVAGAEDYGISAGGLEIDFNAVMRRVHGAREAIEHHDSPERLRQAGVDVLEADGRFVGPGLIGVGGRELRFRSAIVATGSVPVIPPVPGLEEAGPLTTETLWDLKQLPGRLVVVGGGAVGCELGQAFARLGSTVSIVEMEDRLLPAEEPEASRLIEASLVDDGVEVRTASRLVRVEGSPGEVTLFVRAVDGTEQRLVTSEVLVAAGRAPRVTGFGLEELGVDLDQAGAIEVDPTLRTNVRGIFAAGDVTGVLPFTHVAAHQARTATPNALFGLRRKISYSSVPWAIFTDPEVARVGLDEASARIRWGEGATVACFDYDELDRAITDGATAGFAKLIGDPKGTLVGATVAAAGAGEVIGELAAWVSVGSSIDGVSRQVHAYPTLAEGPSRAADDYLADKLMSSRNIALLRPVLAGLRGVERLRSSTRTIRRERS